MSKGLKRLLHPRYVVLWWHRGLQQRFLCKGLSAHSATDFHQYVNERQVDRISVYISSGGAFEGGPI